MESLEPLFEKFAAEATPVNVVLLLALIFMGFIFWLRERERRDLVRQIISLGFESTKSTLSAAQAIETGNKESKTEQQAIQALIALGHKLDGALQRLEKKRR